jgi:hypothetical protein
MSDTQTIATTPETPATNPIDALTGGNATPETPKTDSVPVKDPAREALLIELGREKDGRRADAKKYEAAVAKVSKVDAAEAAFAKGDYLGGLEVLGLDPDDFYLKSTDAIASRTRAAQDPAKIAEEIVAKKLTEHETTKQTEARKAQEKSWTSQAQIAMESAEYPDVMRGIAVGRFTWDDVLKVGYTLAEKGQDSSPKAVLKAIQDQIKPPAGGAAAAAPEKKDAPAVGAPPSALNSDAPPQKAEEDDGLSFEEALAKAKAKYLK